MTSYTFAIHITCKYASEFINCKKVSEKPQSSGKSSCLQSKRIRLISSSSVKFVSFIGYRVVVKIENQPNQNFLVSLHLDRNWIRRSSAPNANNRLKIFPKGMRSHGKMALAGNEPMTSWPHEFFY